MCNWVNGNQRQITKKKVNFVLDLDWTQTKSDWNKTERKNQMKKRMENRVQIKTDWNNQIHGRLKKNKWA